MALGAVTINQQVTSSTVVAPGNIPQPPPCSWKSRKKKKKASSPLSPLFFLEVVKIPVQSQKCGDGEAEIRGLILAILGAPGMRGHHLGAQSLRAMLGHSATEFLKEIIKINK